MNTVLVADIGGTTTRIAYATPQIKEVFVYKTNKKIIQTLLAYAKEKKVAKIAIAAAGIHISDTIALSNNNVKISKKLLEKETNAQVYLYNDIEAIGFAVKHTLKAKILRKGIKNPHKAIISIGTGLGKAVIHENNIYPSEISKTPFPCYTKKDLDLIKNIKHPTYETILSGKGLELLHKKIHPKHIHRSTKEMKQHQTRYTKQAYKLFAQYLARVVKQTILDDITTGGIYLAGGALTKEIIQRFIKEMNDKNTIIKNTSLWIYEDQYIALRGLAHEICRK